MISMPLYRFGSSKEQDARNDASHPAPGKRTNEPAAGDRANGSPEPQGGEPQRGGAWEADEETLAAFGLSEDDARGARYGCENGEAADGDCFLTHDGRSELRIDLATNVTSAMANFHAAIQHIRLDKMLAKDESAWGFVAEFLFYSITGPLIGAALKGFKRAREAAKVARELDKMLAEAGVAVKNSSRLSKILAGISDENATALLQNVSRGARTALKNKAHAADSSHPWDAFLKVIEEQIKLLNDSIVADSPKALDDAEFLILVQGYRNADAHSVATYEGYISDLLARFHTQGLDQINERHKDTGRTGAVRLEAYGFTTTAVLAEHGTGYIRTEHYGDQRGEQVYGDGKDYLISIVDDDLAPFAEALNHGSIQTLHVTEDEYPFAINADHHLIKENDVEQRFKAFLSRARTAAEVAATMRDVL